MPRRLETSPIRSKFLKPDRPKIGLTHPQSTPWLQQSVKLKNGVLELMKVFKHMIGRNMLEGVGD